MATKTSRRPRAAPRRPSPRTSARARARPRARRSAGASLRHGLPELSPHQLDLLGLGLAALGVFLAFVLYLGAAGGSAGGAASDGLELLLGQVAYAVPVALVAGGLLVVARTLVPSLRPVRAGTLCLFAALTLALAAGTMGLGTHDGAGAWSDATLKANGGAVGATLYWATSHLFSDVGSHIIAVFLFIAGLLLLSGVTIAGVLSTAGRGVAQATTLAPRRTPVATTTARARSAPEPLVPPEPEDERLVVRATHVEAPSLDGRERYPDLFADDPAPAGDAPEPLAEEPAAEPVPEPEQPEALAELELEEPEEPGVTTAPEVDPADLTPQGRYRASVTDDPEFVWRIPTDRFLKRSTADQSRPDTAGQEKIAAQLIEALGHFGIDAKVVGMTAGPHITRFEIRLAPGIKVGKVAQLKDDLAYALAATEIRILAPIPGKQAVGVEVPNARRRIVHLGDVFQDPPKDWSPLTVWLGKDVAGRAIGVDLAKMPHLLVAGTTGAGKSGCINAMLSSLLLHADPHELRLVLVDPKQVELNHYESIPHLLTPVITSPRMAANALQNLVKEMEERYGIMSLARTRSLPELNRARAARGEPALPYVLCVIDELADLMMVAPADVEDSIIRLAQKARAVGIHLVLATQSPRVDVITGMIKANVPSRIAFAVSSQTDSRVILDQNGAESLLGQGDMLFSPVGSSKLQRIQGAYIDEAQIAELTESWRKQGEPEFQEELLEEVVDESDASGGEDDGFDPDEDPLLEEAIGLVAQMGTASTSMLQRRLRLGYTRAGRLIDMLERRGIISGYEGSKPRQVLISEADVPRILVALAERPGAASSAPVATAEPDAAPAPAPADDDAAV
ncbi:MAG TPA: DNA translocase FtsK 4TM domain-containing protein [Conexibacter sp.]|nr:DNA translocase FtsK 4TM domain-containing protein [Conexibacter sp.]